VLGRSLAYFVTASITTGFISILAVVWSLNPLGPVGQLPKWIPIDMAESSSELNFDQASSYPDSPWATADENDPAQITQASELDSAATEYFTKQLTDGKLQGIEAGSTATVAEDSTFLLQQGGAQYGATKLEVAPPVAAPGTETTGQETSTPSTPAAELYFVAKYDPGNPLGQARMIAVGAFGVFLLHLFGLSRLERRAAREREAVTEGAG
jgi:hypothetical protein